MEGDRLASSGRDGLAFVGRELPLLHQRWFFGQIGFRGGNEPGGFLVLAAGCITRLALEDRMKKLLLTVAAAAIATSSAYAQTTMSSSEFYVVRDATTKKCTIVDKKPTATTTTIVDNGTFKTRTEAEAGMKTIKVCTEN
jgi:hypothetical protein